MHLGGHDSSCCVLKNNEIELFFLEERYSRIKHHCHLQNCVDKVLDNLSGKVDLITIPTFYRKHNPTEYLSYFLKEYSKYFSNIPKVYKDFYHHRQHASLAFYNSGFDRAAVVVIDGHGSNFFTKNENDLKECETIYEVSYPANFKTVYKKLLCNSNKKQSKYEQLVKKRNLDIDIFLGLGIGQLYDLASYAIGDSIFAAGKAMGLSSYGNDIAIDLNNSKITTDEPLNSINFQSYADYCKSIQKLTEEKACGLIEKTIQKTNASNICITGGYAMNIIANKRYLDQFPNVNFYFEPLANDIGNSIGSGLFYFYKHSKTHDKRSLEHTSFHGTLHTLPTKGKSCNSKEVAQELFKSKSVGIFYKKAEAGQRALGHRSILFNPFDNECKEKVNLIKKREWYRPFAAIVLREDVGKLFYVNNKFFDRYMTVCYSAKPLAQKKISGILHVDNTCRLQIVDSDHHLYKLLKEFKVITGLGILLNTSMNIAGEPLVENPNQALKMLRNTDLDYVYFLERQLLTSDQHITTIQRQV